MDSARQVIRWAIPGTILVLTVGLCQLIFLTSAAVAEGRGINADIGATQAVLAFFAGIPLGFVVFQLYFMLWDSVTPKIPFLSPPVDRGAWLLRAVDVQERKRLAPEVRRALGPVLGVQNRDIEACLRRPDPKPISFKTFLKMLGPGSRRERSRRTNRRRSFAARRRVHWIIAKYLMNFVVPEPAGKVMRAEYMALNDIYHALGASMLAIWVGASALLIYKPLADWHVAYGEHLVASLLASFTILFGALLTFVLLRSTRRRTHELLLNGLAVGIRSGLIARPLPTGDGQQLVLDLEENLVSKAQRQ